MSPLSNATTLANYASGIGTQGATLEVQTANKRVGIGTTNPQGPEGSLQVGTAVTISGNSGIVSATTFHGDFGSSTSVAGDLTVSGVITYEDVTNIDSIGIMTARSDLSIADKIIHTGDTNTAIRFPAADTITAETAGTERMRIDSDGRLLLGTTSSYASTNADNLVIGDNSSSAESGITLGSTTVGGIRFADSSFNSSGIIEYDHSTNHLGFFTQATERMRIDISGNIGIGLINPSARLEVVGTTNSEYMRVGGSSRPLRFSCSAQGPADNANHDIDVDSSAGSLSFSIGTFEKMRIDSAGRLLVGTTSSSAKTTSVFEGNSTVGTGDARLILALGGNAPANDTLLGILRFTDTSHSTANTSAADITVARDGGTWTSGSSMPGRLVFSTTADGASSPTERMRIDSSGRLNIGNTAAAAIGAITNAANVVVGNGTNSAGITIYTGTDANGEIAFADGTSGSNTQRGRILYSHSQEALVFYAGASSAMRIDSSGRMGLGTNSPNAGLNVGLGGDTIPAAGAATGSALFGNATGDNAYGLVLGATSGGLGYLQAQRADGTATTYDLAIQPNGGNVGIGEDSPAYKLHVAGSINAYNGFLRIAGTSSPSGNDPHLYRPASGAMGFWTGSGERMRIDSSGRLLLGLTSQTDSNSITIQGNSGNTAGPAYVACRRGATSPLTGNGLGYFRFENSDGDLGAQIRAQATANWSTANNQYPTALCFHTRDASDSSTVERMRILSGGGITFNGDTASANALDDYEEGTFTPTFMINGSTSGVTYLQRTGAYIKVGHKVTIWGRVSLTNNGSSSGRASIGSLPFTVADVVGTTGIDGGGHMTYQNNVSGIYGPIVLAAENNGTHADLFASQNTNGNMSTCLLYTSPSPRDKRQSRMPSSA